MKITIAVFWNFLLCVYGYGQVPFISLDTNYSGSKVIVPPGMRIDPLFSEGDIITDSKGKKFAFKGSLGNPCFLLDTANGRDAQLVVTYNHQTKLNGILSARGGALFFKIKKWGEVWQPSGGVYTLHPNTIGQNFFKITSRSLTKRIYFAGGSTNLSLSSPSSKKIGKSKRRPVKDTISSIIVEKSWPIEVSTTGKDSLKRVVGFGSFNHSGILFMPDSITVFLTDNNIPSVFFKFIAFKPNDFTEGQLYAYKQSSDAQSGFWLPLHMHKDSLWKASEIALKAGATFFMRLGGIAYDKGRIYLSESGEENFYANSKNCYNGVIVMHDNRFKVNEEVYDNPFGAILQYSLRSDKITPLLYGGKNSDNSKIFSNPSFLVKATFHGKDFLLINEDLPNPGKGRSPINIFNAGTIINELWWLELNQPDPSVESLNRFLIAPSGSKIGGGNFSDDYSAYFITLQNPSAKNIPPFHRSATYGITGFSDKLIKDKKIKQ